MFMEFDQTTLAYMTAALEQVCRKIPPDKDSNELRKRIDPAFLPRPMLFVDRLPRNSTGKLPQEALRAFAAAHLKSAT